jgi:hypothetical protein
MSSNSSDAHGEDHGHTPAAWTGVTIVFLGSMVGAVGVVMANIPLFWVGLAVMAAGGIVGKAMSVAGVGRKAEAQRAN